MLAQEVVSGLAIGSIYAMIAIGFTLIWKSVSLINFAQGDLFMLGAFLGFTFYSILKVPYWVSILLALLATGLVGLLIERLALRPLWSSSPMSLLLATIAMSVLLRNVALLLWGPDALAFPPVFEDRPLRFGGLTLIPQHLAIFAVTFIAISALHLFFQKTKYGKAMRATAVEPDTASLLGINVRVMIMLTFALSAALGGLAGVLVSPIFFATTEMGSLVGLKAFSAAILGGLTNIYGALIGGLLLGVIENVTAGFVSSDYRDAIAFMVMIMVLRFRPSGILGQQTIEKV